MNKYFWAFWAASYLQIVTGCSASANKNNIVVRQLAWPTSSNWGDSSNRSFLESKMDELITLAKEKNPQFPFTAMIIENKSGKEICRGVNHSATNPTLHGEIAAINNCVKSYGKDNLNWPNLTLITTAEPCPMCQSAIIWAGFSNVVYGTSIQHLIDKGWRQINIRSEEVSNRSNFNKPHIIGGVLSEKTDALFVNRKK